MKNIIFILLLVISSLSYAKGDNGVISATLSANKEFDLSMIRQIGATIHNSEDGSIIRNTCTEFDKKGECLRISHILSKDGKDLILHNNRGLVIVQNVEFIRRRLEMKKRNSRLNFTDFNSRYKRNAGDFTGYLGMSCIYDKITCPLLILLPVSIAADLIMLPIDLSVRYSERNQTRKAAIKFIENLDSEQDSISLNNREFRSLLKGLSRF